MVIWFLVFPPTLSFGGTPLDRLAGGSLVCFAAEIDDAYQDYITGSYEDAADKAKNLPQSPQSLYLLGMCAMMLDDHQKARDYFEDVINKYPGSAFKEKALIKTADTFFLEDDFDRARPIYEKLKQGGCTQMPLIYLRLAQIAMKEGRWSQKRAYMDELKNKFPQSAEARYLEILQKYEDYFTIQVGAFTDEGNAVSVKEDLLGKGFSAYLLNERGAAGMLCKVRVGKYSDRKAAKRTAEQLMNEGYPARIIP